MTQINNHSCNIHFNKEIAVCLGSVLVISAAVAALILSRGGLTVLTSSSPSAIGAITSLSLASISFIALAALGAKAASAHFRRHPNQEPDIRLPQDDIADVESGVSRRSSLSQISDLNEAPAPADEAAAIPLPHAQELENQLERMPPPVISLPGTNEESSDRISPPLTERSITPLSLEEAHEDFDAAIQPIAPPAPAAMSLHVDLRHLDGLADSLTELLAAMGIDRNLTSPLVGRIQRKILSLLCVNSDENGTPSLEALKDSRILFHLLQKVRDENPQAHTLIEKIEPLKAFFEGYNQTEDGDDAEALQAQACTLIDIHLRDNPEFKEAVQAFILSNTTQLMQFFSDFINPKVSSKEASEKLKKIIIQFIDKDKDTPSLITEKIPGIFKACIQDKMVDFIAKGADFAKGSVICKKFLVGELTKLSPKNAKAAELMGSIIFGNMIGSDPKIRGKLCLANKTVATTLTANSLFDSDNPYTILDFTSSCIEAVTKGIMRP